MAPPILVFGYGNPSRGDDALGPEFVRRLEACCADAIACGALEVLTDFQLQVEHALDLQERAVVYFVDATAAPNAPPFEVRPVVPASGVAFTTHAQSPAALLQTFGSVMRAPTPATFVVAIRGERFELGEPMSEAAERNLEGALDDFVRLLASRLPAMGEAASRAP